MKLSLIIFTFIFCGFSNWAYSQDEYQNKIRAIRLHGLERYAGQYVTVVYASVRATAANLPPIQVKQINNVFATQKKLIPSGGVLDFDEYVYSPQGFIANGIIVLIHKNSKDIVLRKKIANNETDYTTYWLLLIDILPQNNPNSYNLRDDPKY
jgi:hypothetical protein